MKKRADKKITKRELDDALTRAAIGGSEREARDLLAAGANPRAKSEEGISALAIAAYRGLWGMCQALMAAGADPGERLPARTGGPLYLTALDYACGAVILAQKPAFRQDCCERLAMLLAWRGDAEAIQGAVSRLLCFRWNRRSFEATAPFEARARAARWLAPWLANPHELGSSGPYAGKEVPRKTLLGDAIASGDAELVGFALSICDPREICWTGQVVDQIVAGAKLSPRSAELDAADFAKAWSRPGGAVMQAPCEVEQGRAMDILGLVRADAERRDIEAGARSLSPQQGESRVEVRRL